jgi:hypothetical protein
LTPEEAQPARSAADAVVAARCENNLEIFMGRNE